MHYSQEWLRQYEDSFDPALLSRLAQQAKTARAAILKMTTLAGSGHPGGSMSTIDLLLGLYSQINHDPQNPRSEESDQIVISHGHTSPAAYTALALNGYFDLNQAVSLFRQAGSIYEGHVEPDVPGVSWATGNLGQGLSAGCGFALAARIKKLPRQIYVLMGDGEQQKGQISEARRFANKFKLANLTAFIDYNDLQISGSCHDVMPQNFKAEFLANQWDVLEINGHKFQEILAAIKEAGTTDKPTLIIAHTVMGKGVEFMENDHKWHGQALPEKSPDKKDISHALQELGMPDDLAELRALREEFKPGKCSKPEIKKSLYDINTGKHISYEKVTDNRSAWGNALVDIALNNNQGDFLPLAVFDCDLAGSVKTAEFASRFPANFIQNGIMEHHTAVCSGALSTQGILTFFSDFGVFGIDETYNQHRLNDINETNLKIILTHVGIDVGEDGKTHQCIDYLGQIRNMFNFRALIPADPNQTDHIIRWMAKREGNYLVAMGRSKLEPVRKIDGTLYYDDDYEYSWGKADKLREGSKAALFVMGTMTGRGVEIADKFRARGIDIQLWNISSPQMIPEEVIREAASTDWIFSYEDHNVNTGLAACLREDLIKYRLAPHFHAFGAECYPVSGKSADVYEYLCLDVQSVMQRIQNFWE